MLRTVYSTCARSQLSSFTNKGRKVLSLNPEVKQRFTNILSLKFSTQGQMNLNFKTFFVLLVKNNCLADSSKSESNSKENVPTEQIDTANYKNFVHQNKIGGHMIKLSSTRKKFLVLSGRWKNATDIPDSLPEHQYNSDMWVVRIRVAAFIMVFWLVTCLCVANVGRKHVKERSHQVVMQQYLDSLSPEEREKFSKEFNLEER